MGAARIDCDQSCVPTAEICPGRLSPNYWNFAQKSPFEVLFPEGALASQKNLLNPHPKLRQKQVQKERLIHQNRRLRSRFNTPESGGLDFCETIGNDADDASAFRSAAPSVYHSGMDESR